MFHVEHHPSPSPPFLPNPVSAMGHPLPEISLAQFQDGLRRHPFFTECLAESLHLHYLELRRWNPRLSLVGPGTAGEVIERHYAESLAALPLLRDTDRRLVDLGSGAGFPGLVLAAARPDLEVTLVEARERKWAFLKSAIRRSGLSCRCLNARVEASLPEGFPTEIDLVTSRALAISPEIFAAVFARSPGARFLLWHGAASPQLSPGLTVPREIHLPGSEHRRILEIQRLETAR